MGRRTHRRCIPVLLLLLTTTTLLILPVAAESTERSGGGDPKDPGRDSALKLKLLAMASILSAGAVGVLIPIMGRWVPALRPEGDVFYVVKAFAAGVILSTGLIHILPDAFRSLTPPRLPERPWGDFPFAGFVAMFSAMLTLMVDTLATGYYRRSHLGKATPEEDVEEGGGTRVKVAEEQGRVMHVHTHASHGHSHGSGPPDNPMERIRHRVVSQVLELGIVVHSVIIGISLGASYNKSIVRTLVGALSFHQLFEGMGLGGCIVQARFRTKAMVIMALFFCLTTPTGIAVGIGVSSFYDENSPRALVVEGVLNAASAGILIYMSLVDLLAADFASLKMQSSGKLQLWSYCALFLGAGLMSLVAILA